MGRLVEIFWKSILKGTLNYLSLNMIYVLVTSILTVISVMRKEETINETIKRKYKKKLKQGSIFSVKATYGCHHDTQYEGAREVNIVLDKNPFKSFQNTNCPFQITFKVLKDNVNTLHNV